jgi:hypothetical protein
MNSIDYEIASDLLEPRSKKLLRLAASSAMAQAMAMPHRLYLGALFRQKPVNQKKLAPLDKLFAVGQKSNYLREAWQAGKSLSVWITNINRDNGIRVRAEIYTGTEYITYKFTFRLDGKVVSINGPLSRRVGSLVNRPFRGVK